MPPRSPLTPRRVQQIEACVEKLEAIGDVVNSMTLLDHPVVMQSVLERRGWVPTKQGLTFSDQPAHGLRAFVDGGFPLSIDLAVLGPMAGHAGNLVGPSRFFRSAGKRQVATLTADTGEEHCAGQRIDTSPADSSVELMVRGVSPLVAGVAVGSHLFDLDLKTMLYLEVAVRTIHLVLRHVLLVDEVDVFQLG